MTHPEHEPGTAIDALMRACDLLDADEPRLALAAVQADPETAATRSVTLIASGLVSEREGRAQHADACFEEAWKLGVPLPALLRQCGRYFSRAGRFEQAHDCFGRLEQIRPHSIAGFLADLPERERVRYAPWQVRRWVMDERPHHWFYPPLKGALCRAFGVEGAFAAFTKLARNEVGGVRGARLTSLERFAASRALLFEPLSGGADVRLPSPRVFGMPAGEDLSARTRNWFVAVLENAVVSSKSNLIVAGSNALLDYQDAELERLPVDLSTDPIVYGDEGEIAAEGKWIHVGIDGHASAAFAMDEAFMLTGVNTYNYGHWLLEFLPKLWMLGARLARGVPVLVDEQMPPQHFEALRLFAGDRPVIVVRRGEAVLVRKLWVCSTVAYVPLASVWGETAAPSVILCDGPRLATLINAALPSLEEIPARQGPAHVYLSRADSRHRRLSNRLEVEAWFRGQGFAVIDFGALSFVDQVRLVRGADVLVGPDGSSFMNTFFARPATRIGVLAPPFLEDNEWYVDLSRVLGHHLLYLTGDVVEADPNLRSRASYRIDMDRLSSFVQQLLAA